MENNDDRNVLQGFVVFTLIVLLLVFGGIFCNIAKSGKEYKEQSANRPIVSSAPIEPGLESKMEVRVEFQDVYGGKLKAVVFVKNNSQSVVNGLIKVLYKNANNKHTGLDTFEINDLQPNLSTWGISWVDADTVTYKHQLQVY